MRPWQLVATLALVSVAACAGAAPPPPPPAAERAARQALLDCATAAVAQAGFEVRRRPAVPVDVVEGRRLLGAEEPGTAIDVLVVSIRSQHDSLIVSASGVSGEIVDQRGGYVERVPSAPVRAAAAAVMADCPAQPGRRAA